MPDRELIIDSFAGGGGASHGIAADRIEVLASAVWSPQHGIVGTKTGIVGQLTKCRVGGVTFYVRENYAKVGSFVMASNARMGLKRGETGGLVQTLELCCQAAAWDGVAALVKAADPMGRPVLCNRQFTAEWSDRVLVAANYCGEAVACG